MAYTSGDTILDDHYNDFATSVNAIWGTGTGDSGYGESSTVSAVSAGATITATQWTTLLARISSAWHLIKVQVLLQLVIQVQVIQSVHTLH
jgi:hypothetical protein